MAATVQQISEGALERTLNRLVQSSPEEAAEIRRYFDENREFFLRLGWAVVNRLIERRAPRQAAEAAVKRLQGALTQAEPADTTELERWFRENEPTLVGVALHLAREASPHLVAHAKSGLSLLLRADPNPDFAPGSHEATVKLEPRWFSVESLAEAQELVDKFLTDHHLGSSNWSGGEVRRHGVPFARFSYNRRLWLRTPDGQDTQTELDLNGHPLESEPAAPLALAPSGPVPHSASARPVQVTDWRLAAASVDSASASEKLDSSATIPERSIAPAADGSGMEPSGLNTPQKQGQRWIERKVTLPLGEADFQKWQAHATARRSDALRTENHGQAAFWESALQWLEARRQGAPLVEDLAARKDEGRLWIAGKVRGALSLAAVLRWKESAHEKYKRALHRRDAGSAAFWEGVSLWLDAHGDSSPPGLAAPAVASPVPVSELDRERRAAKIRKQAEGVAEQIRGLRDSGTHNQRPTARRTRILAGQEQEADRLELVRASLLALADAVENKCEPPSLQGLDLAEYRCLPDSLEGVDSRALVEDLLRQEKLPRPRVNTYYLKEALKLTEGVPGLGTAKTMARRLVARTDGESWGLAENLDEIKAVEELSRAAEERATRPFDKSTMRDLRKDLMPYKRALAAGLTTQEEWAQARTDLQNLRTPREPKIDPLERQIRNEERALIGLRIPGYFPTPPDVVERMLVEAELKPGMRVLEPSAGKGSIADAIQAAGIEPDVIEIVPTLRELLKLKKHRIVAEDFLSFVGTYDRILMNPPFEQGQDMEHVRRAYRLLAPWGRVVAIMSAGPFFRTDKQSAEFRRWLEEMGADVSALPEGSFLKSDRPTGVSTRLVVIDKPGHGPLEPSAGAKEPVRLRPSQPAEADQDPDPPESSEPPSAQGAEDSAQTPAAAPDGAVTVDPPPAGGSPAEELPPAAGEATDDTAELRKHGLRVRPAQTQPTRPGKKPRSIWIVEGDTAPYRMALRELGGKQYRGDLTFWEDPTAELAEWLRQNGRPSIEARLAYRQERSAERADRLENRAQRKAAEAKRAFAGAHSIADGIPMGQPILVGHHSEARHRRDVDRIHRYMERGVTADREAAELKAAAAAAEANAQTKRSRVYLHNRIEEARANLADVKRKLERADLSETYKAQLQVLARDYEDQLAHWSAEMDQAGGVPFGPHNVQPGDRVRYRGQWYPVVRANEKTVSIGNWLGSPRLTWKAPWAGVQAHEPGSRPSAPVTAESKPQDAASSTAACPPSNPACGLGLVGGTCTIPAALVLPSGQGAPHEQTARFCLAEASRLIPSHDPTRGFIPRADYPAEVQERRYEQDKGEQMKVIQIAQNLRPELIFNAAPGAIDGPPVVTEQGYVLGGNGRTMGLQLHYHQGGTAAREYVLQHAADFGFTREQVAANRQPVVVRVVPTEGSKRQLQELVRLLNVPLTQALDVRSESVAEARRLSDEALSVLAAAFETDETLSEYLSSRASKPFTEALRRTGIFTDRNASRYLTPLETYTEDGKVFVERLLTAALIPDATLLDLLGPEARQTLARGAPWLLTAASFGGEAWDLRPVLGAAAQDLVRMRSAGLRAVDDYLRQEGMFRDAQPAVRAYPLGPKVLRVLVELAGKPVKFTVFARTYGGYARQHPEGQTALFPAEVLTPAEALARAAHAAGVSAGF